MKKKFVKIASRLVPNLMVNFAYHQLSNPQVRKIRTNELAVLNKAEKALIPFKGFQIQTYKWTRGPKQVLLIHGWEGQAGNFADLIEKLLAVNYTVYAFDGPSHGFSSKGKTSLFEFSELVGHLIEKYQVSKLVSHSFGGVATTFSLYNNKNLTIDKYALLTTPDKFSERIDDVAQQVGISKQVKQKLKERLQNEMQIDLSTMNVSNYVRDIEVKQALIIHDKNDRVIPLRQSKNVHKNWKDCTFHEIEGTGHFRILRTDTVLDKVIEFLN